MYRLLAALALCFVTALPATQTWAGDAEITLKLATVAPSLTTAEWKPGLVSRNVRVRTLSDIGAGKNRRGRVEISKSMDRASSILAQFAKSGRRLPKVILTGTDPQGRPLKYTLRKVLVTSHSTGEGAGETLTLSFTKISPNKTILRK
jgi:hypothetical protein